jgi:hypothetical protein
MASDQLGSLPSGGSDGGSFMIELRRSEAAQRNPGNEGAGDVALLAQTEREQLARDIAEIERATVALRQAEPALESWTDPPPTSARTPRPVWLMIGLLWLATALVAAGAVAAIATLVG